MDFGTLRKRIGYIFGKGLLQKGFLLLVVLLCSSVPAKETEKKMLGDESDGGLSPAPHRIPLYAENDKGEKSKAINPAADFSLPLSTRFTCGECHNYNIVKKGWHFNAVDSNVPSGRPGEPWIYFSPQLYLQIPISYRGWKGTYKPEQVGISSFRMTKIFGRNMPGGSFGELEEIVDDFVGKQYVSGKLEINCLACHNAHYGQDMGGIDGYAVQISRENYRWAAAASSGIALVTGEAAKMLPTVDLYMANPDEKDAPVVTYNKNTFNQKNEVLFNIEREVPNERCYFCHSQLYQTTDDKAEKWIQDADVHIKAGLKCVDCHKNGVDHNILKGFGDEDAGVQAKSTVDTSTCEGCHLPKGNDIPKAGRYGAPIPKHVGIPAVHFDKLTCTACHSGPWPVEKTTLTKTSRAHKLGMPNTNKEPEVLPHIISTVFASQGSTGAGYDSKLLTSASGKIAPFRVLWPAYWGTLSDSNSNTVKPVKLDVVEKVIGNLVSGKKLSESKGWFELTSDMLTQAIKSLNPSAGGKAVYVAGGVVYSLDAADKLVEDKNNSAAKPYLWPVAHNVRPASQALGIRYCTDCHSTGAPLLFGDVRVDTPITAKQSLVTKMFEFQDISPTYARAFAISFVFRPWLKVIALACCAVIAGVLLLYALRALGCIAKVLSGNKE
jgi:Zn-finger protein